MNTIGRMLGMILWGINLVAVAGLLLCAYSAYIPPASWPVLSCAGLAFPVFLVLNLLFLFFWLFFYRRYALLPLAGLIASFGALRTYLPFQWSEEQVPEGSIKVLTYNTMGFENDRADTRDNPNPILDYLRHCDADIICLQEFIVGGRLKKKEVNRALKEYPYRHYQRLAGMNGLGCYSRFPILAAQKIDYESGSNGSVAYTLLIEGDTVVVINNHLESNKLTEQDKEIYKEMLIEPDKTDVKGGSRRLLRKLADASVIRAAQADSIARFIASCPNREKVIVCGDFNDSPLSYAHRVIGEGLTDAFVQSGKGLGISYHRNGFFFRIDHILLGKAWQTYDCTVDRSIGNSDHYPVFTFVK